MTSCRARRVTEGGLKREYVHAPLHSVYGMALPRQSEGLRRTRMILGSEVPLLS